MKFSNASALLLFAASFASAFPRDVQSLQAREAGIQGATFDDIEAPSSNKRAALPDPQPEPEAGLEIFPRDPLSDAEREILQYLRAIKTSGSGGIGGPSRWPAAWSDLHGDNKSQFGGRYVCQVRYSGGRYQARVVAHANQGRNIRTGYVFRREVTVPEAETRHKQLIPPTYGCAIHYLRKEFTDPTPPGC